MRKHRNKRDGKGENDDSIITEKCAGLLLGQRERNKEHSGLIVVWEVLEVIGSAGDIRRLLGCLCPYTTLYSRGVWKRLPPLITSYKPSSPGFLLDLTQATACSAPREMRRL